MKPQIESVTLLAHSLQPGVGGIGRVARLIARVLADEHSSELGRCRAVALADIGPPEDIPLRVAGCGGSRVRFVRKAMAAGWRARGHVFDGCHLAQLHRLPPLRFAPALTFIHGIEVWEKAPAKYVRSARRVDLLLSNSEFTKRKADALHGGFDRARVCWLATEADHPPAAVPRAGGPPEVLIVGRLVADRPKGHRELIACWPRVCAAVPEAVLRIVGRGPDLDALKGLAAASPVADRIAFTGFVPDAEVDALYARATVFAMPSRGEGFGLVYIEAMRHGLPVIGSVHDAAGEVVAEGETGYLIDLDHPDQLAERVVALLRDRDLAVRLGAAGRRRWGEHFRYSAFRERFRPFLRELLA